MEKYDLYKDIAERTDGDIYIGVVGPVRTGKSTMISRMMEQLVLPNMENVNQRERVVDDLPQSGAGKTIMTTQPRFVPGEAAAITIGDGISLDVRLVDCVGYMVPGALGTQEDEAPRMVRTPWFDEDIPFEQAAEVGTRKVIAEHATIGLLVTTDGTIADIPRPSYVEAEDRCVRELKAAGKPFVIVLNSRTPQAKEAIRLRDTLQTKYEVPVILLSAQELTLPDIENVLGELLLAFPLRNIMIQLPSWVQALDEDHWLIQHILESLTSVKGSLHKMRDHDILQHIFDESQHIKPLAPANLEMGEGLVAFDLVPQEKLFYQVLSEACGYEIKDEANLFSLMKSFVEAKKAYDHIAGALESVNQTGYGIVPPSLDQLQLQEPELVRQGNRFGVRLKATAPSLHIIRVDLQTEVSPVVGTEKQSEALAKSLLARFEGSPGEIWDTNIFGTPLNAMVQEGLSGKLNRMPEDVRAKMQETLTRIINDGNGGMICILL